MRREYILLVLLMLLSLTGGLVNFTYRFAIQRGVYERERADLVQELSDGDQAKLAATARDHALRLHDDWSAERMDHVAFVGGACTTIGLILGLWMLDRKRYAAPRG